MTCLNCNHHSVIPDPDPEDWFDRDDVAIVCTLMANEQRPTSRYAADRNPYRCVTVSCRPYNTEKEAAIPDWCPLMKERL